MALPPVLDEENLYKFRTKICERYVKQGRCEFADKCQYSHDLRWTRRPPWKYTYSPELCKDLTFITDGRGRTVAKSNCKQKRNCKYSHTKEEQMYHPNVYKTAMCKHHLQEGWCDRYYCPFGHTEAELRHRDEHLDISRIIPKDIEQESLCPDIYLPSDRPHPKLRARFLAIMDGLCSNTGESNGSKNPSLLQRRTRQPYSDFISSHTPHSIISDTLSPTHGDAKKLEINEFNYQAIGVSGKQSALDRLSSTDAETSHDYKLTANSQSVVYSKTNTTGNAKASKYFKTEDIESLANTYVSDSTMILNNLLVSDKLNMSPVSTTQYPILDCMRNSQSEILPSLSGKFRDLSLDSMQFCNNNQKNEYSGNSKSKSNVCYLSQDVCYWNQPIGRCKDDPSVQVFAGLILGPEPDKHEVVAIKQLPIVVASRTHLVWARIEKLLSLNDSLLVNMKRVFVVFGQNEGTSLWIVLNKCQGSICDLVSRKGLSNSALQDPLPPAGITGMLSHIISAVLLLHQSTGLPHMRIHPGNIMITQQCEIKLGDCAGQVRYLSIVDLLHAGAQGAKNAKSLIEWILNTPSESCWMAPEFLKSLISLNEKLTALVACMDMGSSNSDWDTLLLSLAEGYNWDSQFLKKADVWSVGATLFSLVCGGTHAFGNIGEAQTTLNALEDRKVNAALVESSPWLADLLYSLLAWDPKDRIELSQALCHPVFWQPYELEQYLEALRLTLEDQENPESRKLSSALSYDIQWVDQLHRITSTSPLFSLLVSYISTPYKTSKYLASTYQQQSAASFFVFVSLVSSDSTISLYERRACITQSLLYHSPAFLHSIRLFLYPKVPPLSTFNIAEKSYITSILQNHKLSTASLYDVLQGASVTKPLMKKGVFKPPNKSYMLNAEYMIPPPPVHVPKAYDLEYLISQKKKSKTAPPPPPPPFNKGSKEAIPDDKNEKLKNKVQKVGKKKLLKADNKPSQSWEYTKDKEAANVTVPLYAYQKNQYEINQENEATTQNQTIEKATRLPVMESTVSTAHSTTTQTEIHLINSQQADTINQEERFNAKAAHNTTKETITEQIKDLSPQTTCAVQ